MGLLGTIKEHCVDEAGVAFLSTDGKVQGVLGRNDSGRGRQAFTSEYEIIRGDLVRVMYEASLAAAARRAAGGAGGGGGDAAGEERAAQQLLRYEFGKHATALAQRGDGGVHVTFSDGSSGDFDLVVGADGQGSRTRRMLLGPEASDAAFHSLGVHSVFFNFPNNNNNNGEEEEEEEKQQHEEGGKKEGEKEEEQAQLAKLCHAPGLRIMGTREGRGRPLTQAILSTMAPSERLLAAIAAGAGPEAEAEQKAAWSEEFRGAGWRADELLARMRATGDFYCHTSGQVRLDRWHGGRVVLLGDAGYCPSPNTGMGTTAAFVGSYVLAGELARHVHGVEGEGGGGGGGGGVDAALEGYERVLRPFVTEVQRLPWGMPRRRYFETAWGIWFAHMILKVVTGLGIDKLAFRFLPEDNGGWKVPVYPELNLRGDE